jgi:type IVB pilus formation R64 PilN family outer membrane protein
MKRSIIHAALLSFAAITVGGCTTSMLAHERAEVRATNEKATEYLKAARAGEKVETTAAKSPTIERVSGLYLPVRKAKGEENKVVADALKRRITVNQTFANAQELAEKLTLLTGIPVHMSPDVLTGMMTAAGGTATGGMVGMGGMGGMGGMAGLPPLPGGQANPNSAMAMNPLLSMQRIQLNYDGPISGFLDVVAARLGITADYADHTIRLYRYQTKTFRIVALPGDSSMQNNVGNTSGSQGTSGGTGSVGTAAATTGTTSSTSSQSAGVNYTGLSVWKGIEDSVKGMLSQAGKVTVTAATGTITVTDIPSIVARVESFIEQQNASLSRQVIVNVRVLAVDLTDSGAYGINWDLVYNSLSGNFGWGFSNLWTAPSNSSNLTMKILGTAGSATTGSADIKAWSGSKALISALSTQGHVHQVTSATITTLNNQAAPLQVGRQTSYIANSSTTTAASVGATTAITPGVLTTGFSMNIVPHLLDKGKLMLQYAIDISSLVRLNSVTSGTAMIQTPEVDTRNFLQRVMLNSGDTLVMTGFEQGSIDASSQGTGGADNTWLGGGVNKTRQRSVLVILIQPVIADI